MSHYLQDSAGAGSSSDKDFPASPVAQATPMSPTQIASFVQGSPKDNNTLSEKYKKLKRRFFELEEETSTELQRSSERNVRMREERNMLLDRIIELEAQSQPQNQANGGSLSSYLPRIILNARAHEEEEPPSPSRHTGSPTRKKPGEPREDDVWEAQDSPRKIRSFYSPSKEDQSIPQSYAPFPPNSLFEDHGIPPTDVEGRPESPLQFAPGCQSFGQQNGFASAIMTSQIDGSAITSTVNISHDTGEPKIPSFEMDVDAADGQTTTEAFNTNVDTNAQREFALLVNELRQGASPTRSARAKRAKKGGAADQAGSSPSGRRTSARLARNANAVETETSPKAPRVITRSERVNVSPSLTSKSPPTSLPSESLTPGSTPSSAGEFGDQSMDYIDPLLKPSGTPPRPTSASTSQSPSIDHIVKVAAAAVAAQNAARASASNSPTPGSIASPAPSLDQSPADASSSSLPSPGSISNNPYLALSAVKPGCNGSPSGMQFMMPPMNPYAMYYPTPGAPSYPYSNLYYYMSPMAGPSTAYSPPPPNGNPVLPTPSVPHSPSDVQRAAKPKRLKAHTVTSKQFSIPLVPRDKNGKPMLPLNVGIMTVINLGMVCMREHFHTERYIFPVGYEVTRRYMSTIDPNHEVVYHCTILDGGDGPKFQIIPADCSDRPVIAGTATGAWSAIVRQANLIRNRQHSNSVSGPDFFGLGQNTIKHLIQQLPNADKLRDYVWQHFLEGGPLGGRHAAVIPALPDEYENILPLSTLQHHDKQRNATPPDPTKGLSYYPQHIIQQAQQQQQQQPQR